MLKLNLSNIKVNESVREYAYRILNDNIINLTLPPGTKISEKEISDILSISRTPVREAFIRLSQEKLLEILPQRGTYVSKIDTAQIAEFRFLRITLEQAIIKLACEDFPEDFKLKLSKNLEEQCICVKNKDHSRFFELDNEIHSIIFIGCNKPNIWKIFQEAKNYLRSRLLDLYSKQNEIDLLFEQHKLIVKAIFEKNVSLGYNTITMHINKVISDVNELKAHYPDYFN